MKIGIVTQPLVNNYGGILQNYALQEVLCRMGHSAVTIDQPMFRPVSKAKKSFTKIKAQVISCVNSLKGLPPVESKYEWQQRKATRTPDADRFIKNHIQCTRKTYGYAAMRQAAIELGIDMLVIGSDQVWRKGMNTRMESCFGDFVEGLGIGIVTYAASFGVDDWQFDDAETELMRRLAGRLDAVSVREHTGIALCRDHLSVNAVHVLDPTMLLDKADYRKLMGYDKHDKGHKRMLAYILDSNASKTRYMAAMAHSMGAELRTISADGTTPSVEEWIRNFDEADFVVCDSFHGVVFSIIFNKDFVAISNSARGNSRFHSLLGSFGLEDRLISEDALGGAKRLGPIDWGPVNMALSVSKRDSLDFLCKSILK